jgi:hypothetical protein
VGHVTLQDARAGDDGARTLVLAADAGRPESLTITRVDVWSVARLSVVFFSTVGAIAIGAFLCTWAILAGAGVVSNFEHFVADVTGVKDFHVMSSTVLGVIALAIFLATAVSIALTVLAAAAYNALAALVGGIQVDCREPAPSAPRNNRQPRRSGFATRLRAMVEAVRIR